LSKKCPYGWLNRFLIGKIEGDEQTRKMKERARTFPRRAALPDPEGNVRDEFAQRVLGHELAGFEPILRTRARRLIGARLRQVVGSSDLLQETLLIAVRRFAEISGRPPRQVLAWLLQTMRFRLMRYVRDHRDEFACRNAGFAAGDLMVGSSSPALGRMVREEVRGALLELIGTLPEAERRVIVLLYLEKRSTAEIAEELTRTEGAVRALHQRAVRRLRDRFEERRP
jgi:RNA polymerase sigma-70 factor, ECF subfamily